jgi:signal peptidase I
MRIVGLPGEQVEIKSNSLSINGAVVTDERMPRALRSGKWLTPLLDQYPTPHRWVLGSDEVFVVGDNLANANDSRFWGPLKVTGIIGVAERKATAKITRIFPDWHVPFPSTVTTAKKGTMKSLMESNNVGN